MTAREHKEPGKNTPLTDSILGSVLIRWIVAATSAIAAVIAFFDAVAAISHRVEPLTCKVGVSLSWCDTVHDAIWSDEVGGPGGNVFSPIGCQDTEVLVGLFGQIGGDPFVSSIGPICAPAKLNWKRQLMSISARTNNVEEIGGIGGSRFELKCPVDSVVVGYDFDSAVVGTNFGPHEYLVAPLKLRCSNLQNLEKGSWQTIQGSGQRQGNASHKPFSCPKGALAFGVKGRAGQWVDAISLGCRRL
jgi:hypothetical protein